MKLIPLLILLLAGTADAAISVKVIYDKTLYGCPPDYPFKEDNLRMVVNDGNKKITEQNFCSSYGDAKARIEKDAKGIPYIFLYFGEGRGTNARSEFLSVYSVSDHLIPYLTLPLSGPAGPFSNWHYEYEISKPSDGGFILHMKLKVEGHEPEVFPKEKTKSISIK